MTKFQNELDMEKAIASANKNRDVLYNRILADKEASDIVRELSKFSLTWKCYIFSKSIAFRVGKSSIKSFSSYPDGLKTSVSGVSKTVFENIDPMVSMTKQNRVILIAAYFLSKDPSKVLTESDKTEAVESEQVISTQYQLQHLINEYGSVKLIVGNQSYDVNIFEQVSGRPKADMVFKDGIISKIFVSHKKGSKAGDFQQYGGFSVDLGITDKSTAKSFPEIDNFITEVEIIFRALDLSKNSDGRYDFNQLKKGSNFAKLISDASVAYKVMFGKDYSTGVIGLNNCSILIDGDIKFIPIAGKGLNVFKLQGSYHTTVNPLLGGPTFVSSGNDIYSPAMFLIKSEAQGLNQAGFSNVRAVIWPNNSVVKSYSEKFKNSLEAAKSNSKSKIDQLKKDLLK